MATRRRRPMPSETATAPRRRRTVTEEEPEEETPRRRPRRGVAADDVAETTQRNRGDRKRRARSYDDEDDEAHRPAMPKGFGGAEELRKTTGTGGDFATEMRITEDRQIIKFLDDEPFVVYNQHWFNNKAGKKSYVCPQTVGDECPLCDLLDDSPRTFAAFNVVVVPPEGKPDPKKEMVTGDPQLQVITAAVRLTKVIESEAATLAEKDMGLSDIYFALSKSGKNQQTSYKLNPIKERDLEEDFDVIPLDEDEIEEFEAQMYTEDTFPYRSTSAALEEVAKELLG